MKYITALLMIWGLFAQNIVGQVKSLENLGENLLKVAQSDNPDQIVDYLDPSLKLDKKAQIMESFLVVKDNVFSGTNKDKLQLFNTIKQDDKIYFVITDGQKFLIIRSKVNDQNQIIDHFALVNKKTAEDLKTGQKIYKLRCYSCHRKNAQGGIGPNLTDPYWKYINSEQDLVNIITKGKKGTMMIAYKDYLKPDEIKAVTLYIKALQGKKIKNGKKPEGEKKDFKLTFIN